jgi:large subunit ribosomal protein L4
LAYKVKENNLTVLENFTFDSPKTKGYLEMMKNLKLGDKKTLLVLGESNKNVYLSSRNLTRSKVVTASELNTYDVLNAANLILTEGAISEIEKILA